MSRNTIRDAVPDILTGIQGSQADMRNMVVDMRRAIRDLKAGNARMLG